MVGPMPYRRGKECELQGLTWMTETSVEVACGLKKFNRSRWRHIVESHSVILQALNAHVEQNKDSPFVAKCLSKLQGM